ncbi:thioesterase II family protein [Streptomyces sp. NPDC058011]|uniref:thioesterase II family protein n=1 Tax=Streptomyces sp. NPDC058011 TaxID=3346305 RepID=UPI0036E6F8E0
MTATTKNQRVDLLCIPGAGGSAMTFHALVRRMLSEKVSTVPFDLPRASGRGSSDVRSYAQQLLDQIAPAGPPLILLGHSMGALVAYEMARTALWEAPTAEAGRPAGRRVLHLIVLASPAPDRLATPGPDWTRTGPQDATALADSLVATGELPAAATSLPPQELYDDLRAWQTYRPDPNAQPLQAPITVVGGRYDTGTGPERLERWSAFTTDWRGVRWVPARHDVLGEAGPYTARAVDAIVRDTLRTIGKKETAPYAAPERVDSPIHEKGTP